MSDHVDSVVIGAGVVGLAVGRALALAGRQVVVVERNSGIGEETSARNSEVIHAGLYYPTGSLKAELCAKGKSMLYDYCERKQLPHKRSGKLIVAPENSQRDRLARIAEQAAANGVDDLIRIERDDIGQYEPAVTAVAGLWSPSTGIVDSHALMLALQGDLEAADGIVAVQTDVSAISVRDNTIELSLCSDGEDSGLNATTVVNCAGLSAGEIAASCAGITDYVAPKTWLAKGNYFVYQAASPFHSLVYPLPVDGGLGIHATLDLDGRVRFGPDVEWVETIDYSVDATRKAAFAAAIRTWWPALEDDALIPGYSGIRPKLTGPGEPAADFRIDVAVGGARRQLVHLLGIESPGLTAALAIAEEVLRRLGAST